MYFLNSDLTSLSFILRRGELLANPKPRLVNSFMTSSFATSNNSLDSKKKKKKKNCCAHNLCNYHRNEGLNLISSTN